jgi:glutamate racemase
MDGRRTDIVVLACTHYPFLGDILAELAPWPVTWLDPAPAIARRLLTVLEGRVVAREGASSAVFTSGRPHSPALRGLIARHGLTPSEPAPAPQAASADI